MNKETNGTSGSVRVHVNLVHGTYIFGRFGSSSRAQVEVVDYEYELVKKECNAE